MAGFTIYDCTFGPMRLDWDDDVLTRIQIVPQADAVERGERTSFTDMVFDQLECYFAGELTSFDIPIRLAGTPFQEAVWRELLKIPYGETRTYGQIAAAVGRPQAVRAVGSANNRNPLPFIVPCHRVVGAGGSLVGYSYGVDLKRQLLTMEMRVISSTAA